MGIHVLVAHGDPRFFARTQLDLERSNDLLRQLVLHREDIRELAIKAVGPDVRAARGIDELAGNAHPVARLADAAFQHVTHAEVAADLLHVDRLALVGKARVACDHVQLRQLRRIGDDVLADTVGKILLLESPLILLNARTAMEGLSDGAGIGRGTSDAVAALGARSSR